MGCSETFPVLSLRYMHSRPEAVQRLQVVPRWPSQRTLRETHETLPRQSRTRLRKAQGAYQDTLRGFFARIS